MKLIRTIGQNRRRPCPADPQPKGVRVELYCLEWLDEESIEMAKREQDRALKYLVKREF